MLPNPRKLLFDEENDGFRSMGLPWCRGFPNAALHMAPLHSVDHISVKSNVGHFTQQMTS